MRSAYILPAKLLRGVHRKKINEILDYLAGERLNDTPSMRFDRTTAGIFPTVRIPQSSALSAIDTWTYFGYRFKAATILSIKARAVVMHSAGFVGTIAEQDVNLSGTTAWVYAEVPRGLVGSSPVPVRIGTGRPTSDTAYINLALYRFDKSGILWVLGHCGWWDVNLDLAVASP
jgi:hypothetical protein